MTHDPPYALRPMEFSADEGEELERRMATPQPHPTGEGRDLRQPARTDAPTFCAECEQVAPSHVEVRTDTIGGVTLDGVQVRVCDACHKDRCDPALDDVTLARVYASTGRRPRP